MWISKQGLEGKYSLREAKSILRRKEDRQFSNPKPIQLNRNRGTYQAIIISNKDG